MPARILVVEDDDKTRAVFARALRGQGIEVDDLADGDDAIAAIRSHAYELVLLAQHVPVTDGTHVLEAIRRDVARPVLIVLSTSSEDVRLLAGDATVLMCINKTFAVKNLEPVVAAIVAVLRIH
jgi:DNA-binding response OmpR family regulator